MFTSQHCWHFTDHNLIQVSRNKNGHYSSDGDYVYDTVHSGVCGDDGMVAMVMVEGIMVTNTVEAVVVVLVAAMEERAGLFCST